MRMWRPRLKSVIAVLLLWQLTAALLLAGPAMASVHLGTAQNASATHCHDHGTAGATTIPAPTLSVPAPAKHTDSPDCCQGVDACNCVCAQGAVAIPQQIATTTVIADRSAQPDLRSPPLVRRLAEVFRPPI